MKKPSKYETIHIVQGNYGSGWEDLAASVDRKLARDDLRAHRENENAPFRLISRRVLREDVAKGKF
jgi:hypothetical protein